MGIKSSFIVKNVNVDNVTLEKNGDGQIQIKGGAVSSSLLDLTLQNKLNTGDFLTDYKNSSNALDIDTSVYSFSDVNILHTTFSKTITKNLLNAKIGFSFFAVQNNNTGYYYVYKNGVLIYSGSETVGSYTFYSINTDLVVGDLIEIKVKQNPTYSRTAYIKEQGIYGEFSLNCF